MHVVTRRRRRRLSVLAAASALALGGLTAGTAPASAGPDPAKRAPLLGTGLDSAVQGRYIVVMQPRAADRAAEALRLAQSRGGTVLARYTSALDGFAAELPDRAVAALRAAPGVAYLEADQRVSVDAVQTNPTWGTDRIDQRSRPLNGRYTYDSTGSGVTAYVVDTGIRASHRQFGGRVRPGFTAIGDGRGTRDCNGHGTHVAGTVGGSRYGVAKQVTLRPVRVLGCNGSGSISGVISGVDWVTSHHSAGAPAVANMSLGGSASSALDTAVENSIADGVTYAVAAGNESMDACLVSPARVGDALTVGSTTRTDARSGFSNHGPCLDLFAPGSDITSAWHSSDTATRTISGTSMATPHVAGAAARYLQAHRDATPEAVTGAILYSSTTGKVTGRGPGSPNRLLFSRVVPAAPPGPNLLVNPGFESGATGWTAAAGLITDDPATPARTGTWKAVLGGEGETNTDTISQTLTVPASWRATLRLHLLVTTEEGFGEYDFLRVRVTSGTTTTTVGSFSNGHASTGYVARAVDLSAFTGRTITVRLVSSEDYSLSTRFVVDDAALTTG